MPHLRLDDLFEDPEADPLEGIFGDIVGTIGKIAAAPVNLVASALPKPIREPFKAVSSLASPTALLDPATRKTATKFVGSIGGKSGGGVSGAIRGNAGALGKAVFGGGGKPTLSAQAGGNADVMKTMVQAITAQNLAKLAKPRIQARSTGTAKTEDQQEILARLVASAVSKQVDPKLTAINKKLALAENQRLATSEHNAINNVTAFRRKVLADLMRISACLPENHPTRQKIRRVGIMSGLL